MKPCESCPCPDCSHRDSNQIEMLIVAFPETKETSGGGGGTIPAASSSPDLLNDLHTLRSLAHLLKAQADGMRLWTIAAHCAAVSETCTLAIDHFNAVHPANAKANG